VGEWVVVQVSVLPYDGVQYVFACARARVCVCVCVPFYVGVTTPVYVASILI
jgi:hypothetical protein